MNETMLPLGISRLREWAYRYLLGDDVFISYSRQDASEYAPALAARLTGYICYIDQLGSEPGAELPAALRAKIRRSSVLVLVGSQGAAKSTAIRDEIDEFLKTGRPIVPIDVAGALTGAPWFGVIQGMALSHETEDALRSGSPSDRLVLRIANSFRYTRRSAFLRGLFLAATALLVVVVTGTLLWTGRRIGAAETRAVAATRVADEQRRTSARLSQENRDQSKRIGAAEAGVVAATKVADEQRMIAARLSDTNRDQLRRIGVAEAGIAAATTMADEQRRIAADLSKDNRAQLERNRQLGYVADIKTAWQRGRDFLIHDIVGFLAAHVPVAAIGASSPSEDRRGFEWYLLSRRVHAGPLAVFSHRAFVRCVGVSPRDDVFATGANDGTVVLWDAQTQQQVGELTRYTSPVVLLVFAAGGDLLLTAAGHSTAIDVWDTKTRTLVATIASVSRQPVSAATRDGSVVALSVGGGRVELWNMRSLAKVAELKNVGTDVEAMAFAGDGRTLAVITEQYSPAPDFARGRGFDPWGSSPEARRWRAIQAELPRNVPPADDKVALWDVETATRRGEVSVKSASATSVSFSPDGRWLVAGADDHSVRVVDIATFKEVRRLQDGRTASAFESLTFSPDGRFLVGVRWSADLYVWDVESWQEVAYLDQSLTLPEAHSSSQFASLSGDGERLLAASGASTANLWKLSDLLEQLPLVGFTNSVDDVGFSKDGKLLAAEDTVGVTIHDASTGARLGKITSRNRSVQALDFAADGMLALASTESVELWDAKTRQQVGELDAEHPSAGQRRGPGGVSRVRFSRDGRFLAGGLYDGRTLLWDRGTAKVVGVLRGHQSTVTAVVFGANDSRVVTSSVDGTVKVWDLQSTECLATFALAKNGVSDLAVAPDGSYFAVAAPDGAIRRWEIGTLKEMPPFTGRRSTVTALAISPDGRTLAAGTAERDVTMWDIATLQELGSVSGHQSTVGALAFSPDGRRLASGSYDSTVRLYFGASDAEGSRVQHVGR